MRISDWSSDVCSSDLRSGVFSLPENMCGKPHADLIIRGRMTQADYGIGIYTAPEAARMVGMGAQTLRRWLLGSDHTDTDEQVRHEPALWRPQYDTEEADGVLLGFLVLFETRLVIDLSTHGRASPPVRMTCNPPP